MEHWPGGCLLGRWQQVAAALLFLYGERYQTSILITLPTNLSLTCGKWAVRWVFSQCMGGFKEFCKKNNERILPEKCRPKLEKFVSVWMQPW